MRFNRINKLATLYSFEFNLLSNKWALTWNKTMEWIHENGINELNNKKQLKMCHIIIIYIYYIFSRDKQ